MKNESSPTIIQSVQKLGVTMVTVMFGLQMLRVLMPSLAVYLRDTVGVGSLDLAPIAVGIFSLSFLAGILWRYAGPRTALWISAGGVAIVRVLEQISTSPNLDFYLSSLGVVLFLMFIPKGLALTRDEGTAGSSRFGLAFMLGLALDTAVHVGAGTLDLTWQAGIAPLLIVLVFALGLLYIVRRTAAELSEDNHRSGHWSGSSALFALGPWLLLQMLVFQNVARVSALTGWETPTAGALVILGNALGLAAAVRLAHSSISTMVIGLGSGIVLILSLLSPEPTGSAAALQLLGGQILSFILVAILFAGFGKGKNTHGIARATIANGIGKVLFVLLMFLYYVAFDIDFGFRAPVILLVLAFLILLGVIVAARGQHQPADSPSYHAAKFAAILLIIPLILSVLWKTPESITPSSTNKTVRVISYNLHNGINTDGRLDLEATAKIIEESGADIVALQEVSRGWLIFGSVDMLSWFSQRLDMPYIYGPTGDAQWGNAVLSRYPILSAEMVALEPSDLLLRRGYIKATIDIGGGTITIINTHFTHVDEHDAERDIQSSQLIEARNGEPATLMMGDLNARPDDNAITILIDSGMVDISAAVGKQPTYTYYSTNPDHQIDYIFASSDLGFEDFLIPRTTASDHLPLMVTIILP
ncbi:MAG: endonuclease/exonuclease/phosphatase family protein [Chloroflexi bacterium]|nr:endonuclease/exonuclease/phosphatase family protein [Chloroflexota bacterium]